MSGWDLAVDVSNACRDQRILPTADLARLDRLDRLLDAWRASGRPAERIFLAADDSLAPLLDRADRRRFDTEVAAGRIVTAPVADHPILRTAHESGCFVLSNDRYIDERQRFPWINRHGDRFFQWEVAHGLPQIITGKVVPVADRLVSWQVQQKELRHQGLDPARDRALLVTRWRCERTTQCLQARLWPDHLRVWPAKAADGSAQCPSCRSPLVAVGRRRRTIEVIVGDAWTGAEVLRFPLETRHPIELGRGMGADAAVLDVVQALDTDRSKRVSRRHVRLGLLERPGPPVIEIEDLQSRNGSILERRGARSGLLPGVPTRFRSDDEVELAGEITLTISGKRFVADDQAPAPRGGAPEPTTL